jgi:hypothetical protein
VDPDSGGQANRSDPPGPDAGACYTGQSQADRCRTCGAGDEHAHCFLRHGCGWGGFAKVLEARGLGSGFGGGDAHRIMSLDEMGGR